MTRAFFLDGMMNVLITGASGLVGKSLVNELLTQKHTVVALTRSLQGLDKKKNYRPLPGLQWKEWDGVSALNSILKGEKIDAIINLMGENISRRRWSKRQRELIYNSRINGTKALSDYVLSFPRDTIQVFISVSAIGIYPSGMEKTLTENSPSEKGHNFLSGVCFAWEKEANKATLATRVVIPRLGVVMGKNGGVLKKLVPLFQTGMAGPIGLGRTPMNWIHIDDLVRFFTLALDDKNFTGPYNLVTPNPASNLEFTKALSRALKRPAIFPVPPLMLKAVFGELSSLFLDRQVIAPKKLTDGGFRWKYTDIFTALKSLL